MRGVRRVLVLLLALPAVAVAAPMTVEGQVTATTSRWVEDGSRIVTEATVATPDGDVVVSQLGGSVDGLGMHVFHGPEKLVVGMRVAVAAHAALDLAQRTHVVVDSVRVLAEPPNYVRTGPTAAGNYLYWESGCTFVTTDAAGTKQIPGDAEFQVVQQAVDAWNTGGAACSYMEIVNAGILDAEVGRDRVNLIKFRDASWCRPAVGDDPPRCHAESAAGITTAVYVDDPKSERDGAIVDADIEINGKNFAIAHMGITLGTASCTAELSNTLTHEMGHLLGIEHPCRTAGDPERVDHLGNRSPLCSAINDPAITQSTMYNFQECGETKKATLEAEDIAAVCGIYPKAEDPGNCSPVAEDPGGCPCSAGGTRLPSLPALVLVGLTLLMVVRPRRA